LSPSSGPSRPGPTTGGTTTTLDWLLGKTIELGGDVSSRDPIEIPGVGRDDLALWFREWGFRKGVEIGVKEGDYSAVLLQTNPDLTLSSIDPWLVREEYYDRRGQRLFDKYEAKAREVLGRFGTRSAILKMKSSEAVPLFSRYSLDFAYIDGHHNLLNAVHDMHYWTHKVRPGGIIALHDYVRYRNTGVHVVEAVHAYTSAYRIHPWFVLGRKSAPPGEHRDRHRTCLWVRPHMEPNMEDYDPTRGGLAEMPGA
jgi:hypothetical protein